MITIEDKLNVFRKLVLEKVQNEQQERLNEIYTENHEEMKTYQLKIEKERKEIVGKWIKKGKIEKKKIISKANLEKKKRNLNKKQEFIEKLVKSLKKEAFDFTTKKEYEELFQRILEDILIDLKDKECVTLYVMEKDLEKYKKLILSEGKKYGFSESNLEILPSKEDMIGGIVGISKDMTLRIDSSMITMIEDHRKLIGRRVYDVLKEVGDLNG